MSLVDTSQGTPDDFDTPGNKCEAPKTPISVIFYISVYTFNKKIRIFDKIRINNPTKPTLNMNSKNIFFALKFYGTIGSIYIFQFSFMAAFILELFEYNKTGRGIELIYGFLCLWMSIKAFKMKIAYMKSFTDRIGLSLDKLNNSGFNRCERRIFQRKLIQMKSQNKTI